MYKNFFGLRENPFDVNPDPRYLFLTPQTRHALATLTYGIQRRKGFILLTGEIGTGKTTLINRLLDWLHRQRTHTAFIFNPRMETPHLLDFIMADFGVMFDPQTSSNPRARLNEWLLERYRTDENSVLIVDEAQGLSFGLLEEIRLLLDSEAGHEKSLQVLLVGQPELEETLKRYELRQLCQQITLRCKTAPLTSEETRDYIQTRLHIAGSDEKLVFAPDAIDALHFYSRGIPRVINLLCEHSLINAYVDDIQPVPADIVDEVARDFQFDDVKRPVTRADFGEATADQSISVESTFAEVPPPPPVVAEPTLEAQTDRGISSVAAPLALPKPSTLPNCETGRTSLACERTSECETSTERPHGKTEPPPKSTEFVSEDDSHLPPEGALKPQPIASVPLLHGVESRSVFDLPKASQDRPASRDEASAPRLITNNATTQTSPGSNEEQIRKLRAWPIRWGAWWTTHWTAIASLHWRIQLDWNLLRWSKPWMNPVRLMHRSWPVWRDGLRSIVESMALPGMTASLVRWLQQPWGQTPGHGPHSRTIHVRWSKPRMNLVRLMHRSWPVWRDGFRSFVESMALPGMTASLVRWLQQPWGQTPGHGPHSGAVHIRGEFSHRRF